MPLDPRLLDILCCPACHGDVVEREEGLHCQGCGLLYPVEDGIPVMLVDAAKKVELAKKADPPKKADPQRKPPVVRKVEK